MNKNDALLKTLAASIEATAITREQKIREEISQIYFGINSSNSRPTDSQLERMIGLQKEIDEANAKAEIIFKTELTQLNASLTKAKLPEVKIISTEDWDKMTKK